MLFVAVFGVVLNVPLVRGSGTIYIRADGSIDPPTAPISTVDNVTYTLSADIFDSIVLERDSIVVDGASHIIQGTGSGTGITLSGRSNIKIENAKIKAFSTGIDVSGSSGNSISNSSITDNTGYGIQIYYSSSNTLTNNAISSNFWAGIYLSFSSSNTINNNILSSNAGELAPGLVVGVGISLEQYCTDNALSNNTVVFNGGGISLNTDSNYNFLSGNNVSSNMIGIYLGSCCCNVLTNNAFSSEYYNFMEMSYPYPYENSVDETNTVDGKPIFHWTNVANAVIDAQANAGTIYLINCNNITIKDLILEKNDNGVLFYGTTNSKIENVTTSNNSYGFSFKQSSNDNVLTNCTAFSNTIGIYLDKSSNNVIFHNNLIDNSGQASSYDSANTWDDGYPSGGNYWSDYEGVDLDHDGIGDTPRTISGNDQDHYPLMNPYIPDRIPPTTSDNYDGMWHISDFTINLTAADIWTGVAETYYKISGGPTQNVSFHGQPLITTEGADNTLEYWSVDNAGNEELPHEILTEIKLDKTYPSIETPSRTPDGDVLPEQSVKVSVNVTDASSNVKNATLSYTINDGATWTDLPMNHTMSNLYEATIPPQQAGTTVRFKIIAYDHAGNNATLDGTQPYCVYQVIPEFPSSLALPIFMIITLLAAIAYKRKHPPL
jgi:parallel beta-helix repeat protein